MHSDPELGRRGGGVSYIDARNKGSGSRHSEKELPALSVTKIPLGLIIWNPMVRVFNDCYII
jgi:hypothetical protein